MPGGDRTGPDGQGQMTGRRIGLCVEKNDEDLMLRQQGGRGFGAGRGPGRGRRPGRGIRARFRGRFTSEK